MEAPAEAARPAATIPTPPAPPRRSRFLRNVLIAMFVLVGLVLLAPMSLGLFRGQIEREMGKKLRTTCKLGGISFSWFSGFELADVEIGNAAGFDTSHPFLRLHSLRGDVGILTAMRGRFDLQGVANGLRIWLDQDENGRTNAEALLGRNMRFEGGDSGGGDRPGKNREQPFDLSRLRLDLELTEAGIEIRRSGQVLESLHDLTARVEKEYGTQTIRFDLTTKLAPTAGSTQDGELQVRANVDAATRVVDASMTTRQFDLSRYLPLAAVFLQPGDLTAVAGVANGALQVKASGTEQIELGGDLQVTAPRLAGALLRGMDVRAERWSLQPRANLRFGTDGAASVFSTAGTALDLGFLQVHGLDGEAQQQALAGQPGVACRYVLDIDQLASFGGPMPEFLRDCGSRLAGTASLPLAGGSLPDTTTIVQQLVAQAELTARSIRIGGFDLSALATTLSVQGGKVALTTAAGTQLNTGPLALTIRSDLQNLDAIPLTFELDWRGGRVAGQTAALIRYAVPLLAGLPENGADFAAAIDLQLGLRGPAVPGTGENWLQFLNRWSGNGSIALRDGGVTPAKSLAGLTAPLGSLLGPAGQLGDGNRLAFDSITSGFTMREGSIESKAMRWLAKGRDLGLAGTVHLDGRLDFGIDLTALLQQHRDGRRVAAVLGNKALLAGLSGTLDAPALGLPDPTKLLQSVLQNPGDLLQDEAGKLLQKGLEDLFGKKK
ncbi:MAG: hypothetical protein IPK26_31035 [Planctomycetes bacterium]|nr:hypothetical protein [Planctomycetota bacterium]